MNIRSFFANLWSGYSVQPNTERKPDGVIIGFTDDRQTIIRAFADGKEHLERGSIYGYGKDKLGVDDTVFLHDCPSCGGPAWDGYTKVESLHCFACAPTYVSDGHGSFILKVAR